MKQRMLCRTLVRVQCLQDVVDILVVSVTFVTSFPTV